MKKCSSYFLEGALDWMDASQVEGKLHCPKCGHRVGTLKWAGGQCSCGTWVTPAIQISMGKVDRRSKRPPVAAGIVRPPTFASAASPVDGTAAAAGASAAVEPARGAVESET